jgi:hypothetical protein
VGVCVWGRKIIRFCGSHKHISNNYSVDHINIDSQAGHSSHLD